MSSWQIRVIDGPVVTHLRYRIDGPGITSLLAATREAAPMGARRTGDDNGVPTTVVVRSR